MFQVSHYNLVECAFNLSLEFKVVSAIILIWNVYDCSSAIWCQVVKNLKTTKCMLNE